MRKTRMLAMGAAALTLIVASVLPAATQVRVDSLLTTYRAVPGVSGNLSSVGSDTLNNLMTLWAEGFNKFYPNVRIRRSAKDIIKWKDICEMLEVATDRCEDIANVLETLVVQAGAEERLSAGSLVLDLGRHEATVSGEPVSLTVKEFSLLHLLLRHQGKVVRRQRL